MSIHKSLKGSGALAKHRNVLTRIERINKLEGEEIWSEEKSSVYNLPKVISRKLMGKKKPKKEEGAEAATAEGATAAAPVAADAAKTAKTAKSAKK